MKKLILICAALLLSACGGGGGSAGGGVVVPTPTPVPTPTIDAFFTLISGVVANGPEDTEAGDLSNIPVVEPDTTEAVEL